VSASPNCPVVLLHGWAGSHASTWQASGIDSLLSESGRDVVGVDLLGHGTADKPRDPDAYGDLPGWLLARLESVGPFVDAAGFSLGALTLLRALVIAPERFGKVLLAGIGDGVFDPPDATGHSRIVDALEGRSADGDAFAHAFVRHATQPGNDLEALTAIMKRPPSAALDPNALSHITNDVLVVIGDKDFAAPATRLANSFPNGRLVILRNVDHFATPEAFSFIDELLGFFGP
jgi:pimeloyl-ACP methyl ester carboxylesterase